MDKRITLKYEQLPNGEQISRGVAAVQRGASGAVQKFNSSNVQKSEGNVERLSR
jgi:hypothetical protein